MSHIIPAILPAAYFDLEDKVDLVKSLVPIVQLDVCDGVFVPSRTWPYGNSYGNGASVTPEDDIFDEILSEERGLPFWEQVNYEIHLMVEEPDRVVSDWVRAGAARIVLPAEKTRDVKAHAEAFRSWVEIGLAFNLDTPIQAIAEHAEHIAFVQCMGIAKPGFQGQPFDERVIAKVAAIRQAYPHMPISVDGGVNMENAQALIDAGATRLVIGSALFAEPNLKSAIDHLDSLFGEAE